MCRETKSEVRVEMEDRARPERRTAGAGGGDIGAGGGGGGVADGRWEDEEVARAVAVARETARFGGDEVAAWGIRAGLELDDADAGADRGVGISTTSVMSPNEEEPLRDGVAVATLSTSSSSPMALAGRCS